mmetsp:Transcript_65915/g.157615  ORF Transcript_65915/g.157615 Transcript_65915/m.157615 type:complete len:292 (+) Transcript_65915:107-982(+)
MAWTMRCIPLLYMMAMTPDMVNAALRSGHKANDLETDKINSTAVTSFQDATAVALSSLLVEEMRSDAERVASALVASVSLETSQVIAFTVHVAVFLTCAAVYRSFREKASPAEMPDPMKGTDGFSVGLCQTEGCLSRDGTCVEDGCLSSKSYTCTRGPDFWICCCAFFCLSCRWADTLSQEQLMDRLKPGWLRNYWLLVSVFIILFSAHILIHGPDGEGNTASLLGLIMVVTMRQKLRTATGAGHPGLEEDDSCCSCSCIMGVGEDCLSWCCCPCCAAAQEARHVERYMCV